jgi:hypothetical protein
MYFIFLLKGRLEMGRGDRYIIIYLLMSFGFFSVDSYSADLNSFPVVQDTLKIMNWKTESSLRTFLLQEMHQQYDQRRRELASAMKSETAISEYSNRCREKYLDLLGEFPDPIPLNATITRRIHRSGYTVEDIIFESRPSHHVTANLYIPDGKGAFPAVLMFCGHEMTSKTTDSYQKTAILFALNGFAVMVVDPVSQGERVQFTDSQGIRILRGSTTEHTLLNAGANLVGSGIVAWELYDNVRALDYLTSRPEIDSGRIGCIGNSGGGTQTAYFIAFDDRIKVAAPCSFIARRERNFELTGANDGCQHIPCEGQEHLEIGDFLIMFAPKPVLILAGRYDFVDYTGTLETYEELSRVYSIYKAEEKLNLFTFDDGHGISLPKREAVVEWFTLWLRNEKVKITEENIQVHDESSLNCTPAGQVNSLFRGEMNVQNFSLQKAKYLASSRDRFLNSSTISQKQAKIKELLAIGNDDFEVNVETTGEDQNPEYIIRKIILRREGEVPLPCMIYSPIKISKSDTIIIWLNETGKSEIALKEDLILNQIRTGRTLILADLRGMGETAEKPGANEAKYYNREYHNAMLSLHIGKPLPGQRVDDIFTVVKFIKGESDFSNMYVKIIATGAAAEASVYAAALEPAIKAVEASGTIKSYFEILENPLGMDLYSYVVPGVLKYFDLPDIAALQPGIEIRYK